MARDSREKSILFRFLSSMTGPSLLASIPEDDSHLRRTVIVLFRWGRVGVGAIALYAFSYVIADPTNIGVTNAVSIFSFSSVLALAFTGLGALLGFLFAIPRSGGPASSGSNGAGLTEEAPPVNSSISVPTSVNTNLSQVSDWLTKLLLGVGLAEMDEIPGKLVQMAEFFKPSLNDNRALVVAITLNFSVFGFFCGYLLTRLFLAIAFSTAERREQETRAAKRLEQNEDYRGAIARYEGAVRLLTHETPKEEKCRIYEGLTYNYLYEDAPLGFSRAIQHGVKYVSDERALPSAKVWASLAAAYGQQFEWERRHEASEARLSSSRNAALNAMKKAIEINPQMRDYLRSLWDKNNTVKEAAAENDLEVFFEDEEFKAILSERQE